MEKPALSEVFRKLAKAFGTNKTPDFLFSVSVEPEGIFIAIPMERAQYCALGINHGWMTNLMESIGAKEWDSFEGLKGLEDNKDYTTFVFRF